MGILSENWITEKTTDFEYKKYVLLAWLQQVEKHFGLTQLYPSLAELVHHYRNAVSFRESKKNLHDSFPQKVSEIDLKNFRLRYEEILEDDQMMQDISRILDFSIPKFETWLNEGKKIYEFVEEHLNIQPVGVVPLQPYFGYLFIRDSRMKRTDVHEYEIKLFEQPEARYRGIHTNYVCSFTFHFSSSYESIKSELLKAKKDLANPATYAIESEMEVPMQETLLPMAKRLLIKYVSSQSFRE